MMANESINQNPDLFELINKGESLALWERKSKQGNIYYHSVVKINGKDYHMNLFPNDRTSNDKRPAFNILVKEHE